jgi:pilus assembly protein FimV
MESSTDNEQNLAGELLDIGDDLVSETFDEDTLEELLNDEESEYAIELSPDFSDKNVLADLLNDNDESTDSKISEASEINDIQELDNLDFDELLANIEEESSVANKPVDFNQNDGPDDEITLADFDNFSADNIEDKVEDNFVSVDSLLSDSQFDVSSDEPYEKTNIDVGLNEFPEFTDDVNQIDVDIDENGIAAKLDLAKVYLEIGDEDNALVILKEVLKLGDSQQQAQAQSLLDNLE